MVDAALSADALGKRYRSGTWALRALDLVVPAGSITALVGPNGAGKSTLMKAWVGFERPTEGSVAILGIDPWVDRRAAVGQTGYVPQSPSLYRDLSAEDHLALAKTLRPAFEPDAARKRLLQLGVSLDAKPTELSGGQQAQLCLAIALGTRAPVLLLDEPLASLDPLARREFLAVLTDAVRSDGATAVISSHIITDVEAACDRIVVLSGGRALLDADIKHAISSHVVVTDERRIHREALVSAFNGPDGETLYLAGRNGADEALDARAPSLEEVVIGFLTSGRAG